MIIMKTTTFNTRHIVLLKELIDGVDSLLNNEIKEDPALQWKKKAGRILMKVLGENHIYVKEFDAIRFNTTFIEDLNQILVEDTYRLGLEDAKSFLISLVDELESEHLLSPGLMDIESLFAEMNRYVCAYIEDPYTKNSLHHRITHLRNGMMTGDISSDEIKNHVENIGYLDTGLFERIVPLLTWYYIQRVEVNGASNN